MLNELLAQLKELKPGKGLFVVGDTTITYDVNEDGYSIKMVSCNSPRLKAESTTQADKEAAEAARQRALAIKAEIEERVKIFKEDMEKLNDDVFQEACEMFNKNGQYLLNDLAKAFDRGVDLDFVKDGIQTFKRTVNQVIFNKIDDLKKQIIKN